MSEQDKDIKRQKAASGRSIRSMTEAVDEMKVYGDDEGASAKVRRSEKTPSAGGKKASGKKSKKRRKRWPMLVASIFGGKQSGREWRIFGLRLTFWPLLIGVVAILMLGLMFLESRNLSVDQQTVTIVGLESDLEGYKILQLSDLNGKRFGDKQSTLLREIDTLDYDVVFITGDMVGPGGDPKPFYELLEGLPSRKQVYFIAGDSDPGPYAENARGESGVLSELVLADWILGAIERGAIYVDAPMKIEVGSASYWLSPATLLNLNASETAATRKEQMEQEQTGVVSGIQADYATLPFTSYRYSAAQKLLAATSEMQPTDLHIAMAHVPPADDFIRSSDHGEEAGKYLTQPELILAGHNCGGVWKLPLLGAFYVPDSTAPRYGWFPADEDVEGLSAIGESQMYISAGLSTTSDAPLMAFRFMNRPQVSVITLTATLPTSMLDK